MKHILPFALFVVFGFGIATGTAQVQEYNLDETYQLSDGAAIHLESDDADVSIRGSDRSDLHLVVHKKFRVEGDKDYQFKINVKQQNGDLYIKEHEEKSNWFNSTSIEEEKYRITIETPRNVSLDIEGDDDRYEITDISGAISLDADDTNVDLQRIGGKRFQFSIDDGSIKLDQGRGTLNLEMDDGEFTVGKGKFQDISAEADDGSMNITTDLMADGSYEFHMDDGGLDFKVTRGGGLFTIAHDDASIQSNSAFNVHEKGDTSEYRLDGGNATIDIQTDDGRIRLRN